MAKNDNAHSVRLVESLRKNISSDAAKDFEEKYPLSKSANIEKKHTWAEAACDYLEANLSQDEIIKVRKACICNDGKSSANKMIGYLNQVENMEAFVGLFNQNETFASFTYISENKLLFCYPECYCACVKRVAKELSKTWCYCTLGYAESLFREVFKKDVKVTLLESIKAGADQCVMEVEW